MLFGPVSSKKFQFEGSFDADISKITSLRQNDPEKARELFQRCESLIEMASRGEYRKFRSHIDMCENVC
jgi:hypothetical protein